MVKREGERMDEWVVNEKPNIKPRQAIKESDYVLVCNSMGIINVACYREHKENIMLVNNGWYDKNDNLLNDVIAWMPLPKPHQRGEEE